jgi:hypothetical protein
MKTISLTRLSRLIPKADRKKVHEYLFREGVLVAKKDFNLPKHGDIDTKNLYVCSEFTPKELLFPMIIAKHLRRSPDLLCIVGDQSLPIPHLPRLPQDPVLLAILLLHPHSRGS